VASTEVQRYRGLHKFPITNVYIYIYIYEFENIQNNDRILKAKYKAVLSEEATSY
jgi:hypothetical protein